MRGREGVKVEAPVKTLQSSLISPSLLTNATIMSLLRQQPISLLYCCTVAVVELALSAPLSQQQCGPGQYLNTFVGCALCPGLAGNSEVYLKSFALEHTECPYPPSPDAAAIPVPDDSIPTGEVAPNPGNNVDSQPPPSSFTTVPATTNHNTTLAHQRKLVENLYWFCILIFVLAVIGFIVWMCRNSRLPCIRRTRSNLATCLTRGKKTSEIANDAAKPLNDERRGENENEDESQDQDQNENQAQPQDRDSDLDRDQHQGNDQDREQDQGSDQDREQDQGSDQDREQDQGSDQDRDQHQGSDRNPNITGIPQCPMIDHQCG